MMNTFVVYVENKPGVLTRVASLFRRRAFNIDSLTVGRTEKPEVSRMTITAEADQDQARRIEANLYKLVNVLLVENITHEPSIVRDLAMIKVAATHEARSHVLELASVFRARVVDVAPDSLTIEITGAEDKIDGLLEVLIHGLGKRRLREAELFVLLPGLEAGGFGRRIAGIFRLVNVRAALAGERRAPMSCAGVSSEQAWA